MGASSPSALCSSLAPLHKFIISFAVPFAFRFRSMLMPRCRAMRLCAYSRLWEQAPPALYAPASHRSQLHANSKVRNNIRSFLTLFSPQVFYFIIHRIYLSSSGTALKAVPDKDVKSAHTFYAACPANQAFAVLSAACPQADPRSAGQFPFSGSSFSPPCAGPPGKKSPI